MDRYNKWASRKYSLKVRILTTLPAGLILLGVIPYILVLPLRKLDGVLGLLSFYFGWPNMLVGGALIVIGGFFALWSVLSQILRAEGTPLPMMPTQRLLVDGPFRYSRNPMTFGALAVYFGISVLVGSLCAVLAVALIGTLLLVYLRTVEEKELVARFGQAYVDYCAVTPFFIPKICK